MMRAAIIVNPAKADVSDLREPVDKTLAAAGWSTPVWLETTPEDPGHGMAEAAVAAGVQLVVICGGDGTIMACLGALSGTDVPVALLPLGTGNLLARNLGVPIELDDALAVAVDGEDRRIDLGRVGDQPFAVMAGIGFDAAMMADASEGMKQLAGWPAYVVSGLRHLRDPVMRVQLRIDGGPPLRRSARTVLVGNVGRLQGGLELLPDAAADDGLLDVVVVAPRTLRDWIRLAWRIVSPRSHAAPASRTLPWPHDPDRGRPDRAPPDGRRGHRRRASHRRADRSRALWSCACRSRRRRPPDRVGRIRMSTATRVPETTTISGDELSADDAVTTLRRYGRWNLVKNSFIRFRYADGFTNARALALQFCLSFIPLIIAVVGLASAVHQEKVGQVIIQTLAGVLPGKDQGDMVEQAAQRTHDQGVTGGQLALWLGLLAAIIALTTAMGQIERGANRIYGIERDRPALRKYGRALLMALTAGLLLQLGFLVIIAGDALGEALAAAYGWGEHVRDAVDDRQLAGRSRAGVGVLHRHPRARAAPAPAGVFVAGVRVRRVAWRCGCC